ncbi:hypothetical protein [Cellulomonas soli]
MLEQLLAPPTNLRLIGVPQHRGDLPDRRARTERGQCGQHLPPGQRHRGHRPDDARGVLQPQSQVGKGQQRRADPGVGPPVDQIAEHVGRQGQEPCGQRIDVLAVDRGGAGHGSTVSGRVAPRSR